MSQKLKCLLISGLFLMSQMVIGQKSETGNWIAYFGNQGLSKKWNVWNEVQYRNYNFAGDLQQLLIRVGVGYNLTENNNNLHMGYGFIRSRNYLSDNVTTLSNTEHRIYQQFITRQSFGRVHLQHRFRLEERFIADNVSVRFRYLVGVNIPFNRPKMEKGAVYFSAYNEIFINRKSPKYDRNRIY
ncbi:MAG: DUF2490 domain-containing protein, partial [Saprospiraceae bacterium]